LEKRRKKQEKSSKYFISASYEGFTEPLNHIINHNNSIIMHLLVHFNAPVPELNGPFSPRVHQKPLKFFCSGNPYIEGERLPEATYGGLYEKYGGDFGCGILYEDGFSMEYTLTLTPKGLQWKFHR
jgi:hypothetical protein